LPLNAKRSPGVAKAVIVFGGFGAAIAYGFVGATITLVRRVDGTVVEAQGTGKAQAMKVDTGDAAVRVAADHDLAGKCPKGAHVVKPAFRFEYTCDGRASGPMWSSYIGVLVVTAFFAWWCILGALAWRSFVRRIA